MPAVPQASGTERSVDKIRWGGSFLAIRRHNLQCTSAFVQRMGERERETETERQRDRETDRQRDRERETETETDRERGREGEREKGVGRQVVFLKERPVQPRALRVITIGERVITIGERVITIGERVALYTSSKMHVGCIKPPYIKITLYT